MEACAASWFVHAVWAYREGITVDRNQHWVEGATCTVERSPSPRNGARDLASELRSASCALGPPTVFVAGPPLVAAPLGASLAAALGCVLVSPAAAIEAAVAAAADADAFGSGLQAKVAAGDVISGVDQATALARLLVHV